MYACLYVCMCACMMLRCTQTLRCVHRHCEHMNMHIVCAHVSMVCVCFFSICAWKCHLQTSSACCFLCWIVHGPWTPSSSLTSARSSSLSFNVAMSGCVRVRECACACVNMRACARVCVFLRACEWVRVVWVRARVRSRVTLRGCCLWCEFCALSVCGATRAGQLVLQLLFYLLLVVGD